MHLEIVNFENFVLGLEVHKVPRNKQGFEQDSAIYLGSNRILQGSWLHGPPSLHNS